MTTTTSLSYWNNPRSKTPTGVALAIIWQYLKTKNFPTLDKTPGLLRKLTNIGVPLQWHLKIDMLKTVFNVALWVILFPPPPPTPTFDVALEVCVCVCVWLFLSFCFLFSLSYWLYYFSFFKSPLVIIIIIYKDWKNHVILSRCARSSMCTKGGRERRWGKKKKLILQKQIQFQTLNIPLILAGGSLLFCFV